MKTKHLVIVLLAIGYFLAIVAVIKYEVGVAEKAIQQVSCTPIAQDRE